MSFSFDLLQAPWVPCIRQDGTIVELGVKDTLVQAHELRELHGESPLVTAALYRLLLAVLHRVFGPSSYDEWGVQWESGRWDVARLEPYLERWQNRFDLFDAQQPFYQAADPRVNPKSVTSLVFEVASGNNPTLFDHHTDVDGITLTPSQAARMLIAAQAFGLAGLSGLPQKFTDGPCARGIVFVVQGQTLFETLALNLIRYTDESPLPRRQSDRPAWEMDDPFSPDRSQPLGYLDYLTWHNRRILLLPQEAETGPVVRRMTMAPALRLNNAVLNPMTHYRRDKRRGPLPLAFSEGRALWRDSAALFQLRDDGYQPPQSFHWLSGLVEEGYLLPAQKRRYLALGMSKKQAKVFFFRDERMPLPLEYLIEPALAQELDTALAMASAVARQLWGTARTLATLLLSPEADTGSGRRPDRQDLDNLTQGWAMERRYWSRLEIPFRETMEALPDIGEQALVQWRKVLIKTAWDAFEPVADNLGADPRSLKAIVRARGQLAAGLAKSLPA